MSQEKLGTSTPVYNKLFYNVRGQLSEIRESTTPNDTSWDRGAIINHYSDNCWGLCAENPTLATDDNGNLKKQDVYIPRDGQSPDVFTDYFSYDSLNRLKQARETLNGSGVNWQQTYSYDRWGNRTIDQAQTFGAGVSSTQFTVNLGNTKDNRLGVPSGQSGVMSYDDAGNLTTDTYTGHGVRTFDAENRMTSAALAGGGVGRYTYNAEGQRTRRNVTNQAEVWQVYGMGGELVAEYAANAGPTSPQKEYGYRNGQLLVTADSPGVAAPSILTAEPNAAGTAVALTWSATGAANYRVERGTHSGGYVQYTLAGTSQSTSFSDGGVTSGAAYLYRLCAADGAGNCVSSYSAPVMAAARAFADDPLVTYTDHQNGINLGLPLTDIRALHITQLREAVNAVRALAGLAAATWTNPTLTPGQSPISADDVRDLRSALAEALSALGIPPPSYTDPTIYNGQNGSWTVIKRDHVKELRLAATRGAVASGGAGAATGVQWLVADQLGTPRMIFEQSGSLSSMKRHDYLPFGEEIGAGVGGRTPQQGYTGDSTRQRFTGQERDTETGLDYFGARYYGSMQGRFTSPDEFLNSGRLESPQTWNRYAYVLNNPLAFTDPSGFYEYADGTSDKDKKRFEEQLTNARAQLDKIKARYVADSAEYKDSKRALDAYGGVGEKNGVFVGFGKTSDGGPGETSGFFNADGSGKSINVTIDLSKNKADNLLMGTIAHEGSHVQDRADLVNGILANPLEAGAVAAKLNITVGATETKAYTVQSVFAEFTYKNEQIMESGGGKTVMRMEATQESAVITGTGVKVWNPSWAGADIAKIRSQRSAAIAEGLSKSSVYKDKLNKPILR
jgi:RHS repeat-associated protein